MNTAKVFVSKKNTATFVCPQCQKTKIADVSRYKTTDKAVRVKCKCPCGHTYQVLLERRKHFRKSTRLSGIFVDRRGEKTAVTILDLSLSGVKFTVDHPADLFVGDRIMLEFRLDNQAGTFIRREAVVRNIRGPMVGAEFAATDHYDHLGFYLL